jgi:hypothetical protein
MKTLSNFFSEPLEPTQLDPAELTDQDRYEHNLQELEEVNAELANASKAVAAYGQIHRDTRCAVIHGKKNYRLDAMTADPHRQRLESECNRIIERRNVLLTEHAGLKMALGLTR